MNKLLVIGLCFTVLSVKSVHAAPVNTINCEGEFRLEVSPDTQTISFYSGPHISTYSFPTKVVPLKRVKEFGSYYVEYKTGKGSQSFTIGLPKWVLESPKVSPQFEYLYWDQDETPFSVFYSGQAIRGSTAKPHRFSQCRRGMLPLERVELSPSLKNVIELAKKEDRELFSSGLFELYIEEFRGALDVKYKYLPEQIDAAMKIWLPWATEYDLDLNSDQSMMKRGIGKLPGTTEYTEYVVLPKADRALSSALSKIANDWIYWESQASDGSDYSDYVMILTSKKANRTVLVGTYIHP